MALKKSFNTQYGTPATYWKVGLIKINWHTKQCTIKIMGFVNKQARDEDMACLTERDYSWTSTGFTFDTEQKITSQLYSALKLFPTWADAEDA